MKRHPSYLSKSNSRYDLQTPLDSYHDVDLTELRAKWERAIDLRKMHIDEQLRHIDEMAACKSSGEFSLFEVDIFYFGYSGQIKIIFFATTKISASGKN